MDMPFTTPKAYLDWQTKLFDVVLEASDETAKRAEQSFRETATAMVGAWNLQAGRAIDAMTIPSRFRTRSVELARQAWGATAEAAAKA